MHGQVAVAGGSAVGVLQWDGERRAKETKLDWWACFFTGAYMMPLGGGWAGKSGQLQPACLPATP